MERAFSSIRFQAASQLETANRLSRHNSPAENVQWLPAAHRQKENASIMWARLHRQTDRTCLKSALSPAILQTSSSAPAELFCSLFTQLFPQVFTGTPLLMPHSGLNYHFPLFSCQNFKLQGPYRNHLWFLWIWGFSCVYTLLTHVAQATFLSHHLLFRIYNFLWVWFSSIYLSNYIFIVYIIHILNI